VECFAFIKAITTNRGKMKERLTDYLKEEKQVVEFKENFCDDAIISLVSFANLKGVK